MLHAAFLAAAEDAPIGMGHMLQAVRREHYKMGRVTPEVRAATGQPGPRDGRRMRTWHVR